MVSVYRSALVVLALATIVARVAAQKGAGVWERHAVPQPAGARYTSIDFADSLHGWVMSDSGWYTMTPDAGRSWSAPRVLPGGGNFVTFKMYDSASAVAVLSEFQLRGACRLLVTTDRGGSWKQTALPSTPRWNLVSVLNRDVIGFIDAGNWLFTSTDLGSHWDADSITIVKKYASITSLGIMSRDRMFIGGGGERNGYGFLYLVTDGGKTWTEIDTSSRYASITGRFMDTTRAYFWSTYGFDDIWFTGTTAYNACCDPPFANFGDGYFQGALFDDGTSFACAYSAAIYRRSPDPADSTWAFMIQSYGVDWVRGVVCASPGRSWILGTSGDAYRRIDAVTSVHDPHGVEPEHLTLLQNYPNPFNPQTTVRYFLPSAGTVDVRVTDVLGREVYHERENQTPGWKTGSLDLSGRASGIYYCTIRSGGGVQTVKMAFVR